MIAAFYQPAPPLGQFIDSFFYYTDHTPQHRYERFLPDGHVHLLIDLTETPQFVYDNDSLEKIQQCQRVWFSGFRTVPITIPSGKETEMIVVNFHRAKAFPFLREPLHALTDLVIDAEQVLSNDILSLRAQLQDCPDVNKKFVLLENALLKHFRSRLQLNPFVDHAVARIAGDPRHCNLQELSQQVGFSQKHLIKLFKDQVGVTPKEFLKVSRFQKAVQEIESKGALQWTAVADDCGYYDQSHFIADFKTFSGLTPAAYLRQRGELLNYLPVA